MIGYGNDGRDEPWPLRPGPSVGNRYGERSRYGRGRRPRSGEREYHGSYGSGGRRFEDFGRIAHADDDNYRGRRAAAAIRTQRPQGYGRQPQGYDYDDRGFFARAGDEVRSWFGDEEAERRREHRLALRRARYDNDPRQRLSQLAPRPDRRRSTATMTNIAARTARSSRTNSARWRTDRQAQRDLLNKVEEHADVVGSDGEHVGTVDKVRGDRILLTKNDADAGGRHHSIPSSWMQSVDDKVTLSKTAGGRQEGVARRGAQPGAVRRR